MINERISSGTKQAFEQAGRSALELIDHEYGTGYPDFNRTRRELAYHNGFHARVVGSKALELAQQTGLNRIEQAVASAAGYAHDIVQLRGRGGDEHESAGWLRGYLTGSSQYVPPTLIEMGTLAVIGTEPVFEGGCIVGQKVTELDYPSKSAERVARTVASADMALLFTPLGPLMSHLIYQEMMVRNSRTTPPLLDLPAFQRDTMDLLANYRYPMREADKLFATHRKAVRSYHEQVAGQLERGEIVSWEQLISQDMAFMNSHK